MAARVRAGWRDGKELFFLSAGRQIVVVSVKCGTEIDDVQWKDRLKRRVSLAAYGVRPISKRSRYNRKIHVPNSRVICFAGCDLVAGRKGARQEIRSG
jgi:hypothetical protein